MALTLAAVSAAAQGPEATAVLDPEVLGLSELAELRVTVRGAGPEAVTAPRFLLDNLEIAAGPETAVGARDAGGGRVYLFRWLLRPQGLGPARVYGLRVSVAGRRLELPVRRLTVQALPTGRGARPPARSQPAAPPVTAPPGTGLPAEPSSGPPQDAGQRPAGETSAKIFLRAETRPDRPWRGQQVLYTLFLYYQSDVHSIRPVELPDFSGFWTAELSVPGRPAGEPVSVSGESFQRAVLLRRVLFPLRSGRLEIEPVVAEMIAETAGPEGVRGRLLERRSNGVTLEVRELPEPAPPGFSGVVGQLEVETRWEPETTTVGEAVALVTSLEGDALLSGVELPQTAPPAGLADAGGGEPRTVGTATGGGLRQRRTWRRLLVPQRAGRFRPPVLELAYFDPVAGVYRQARAEPSELVVGAGGVDTVAATPEVTDARAETATTGFRWAPVLVAVIGSVLALALMSLGATGRWRGSHLASRWQRFRHRRGDAFDAEIDAALRLPAPAAAAGVESAWRRRLRRHWPELGDVPPREWPPQLRCRDRRPAAEIAQRLVEDLDFLRRAPYLADTDALKTAIARHSRRLDRELGSPAPTWR